MAMPIIVQKYGGSSVSDLEKIREIARKVVNCKAEGNDVVVVVSAMGKTTNELLSLAKQLTDAPPRRELDMLLTTGERITSALLSIAIHAAGYEAVALTGSQCGILTNDRHSDARIIEVRPVRVEDELARGRVVIVAGFQGMSYKREITTLGRGGSDTTAVALAAALSAERCEIYSDVDGVYTADPAKVLGARHLAELSYEEMQEMAMAGAKVLKAEAVEFAKQAGIAIYARASFAAGRETVVRKNTPSEDHGVRAVVSEQGIAWVGLRGTAVTEGLADLLSAAEASLTPIKELRIQNSQGNTAWARGAFAVSTAVLPDWSKTKSALLACVAKDVDITEGLAAVSLIGVGINRDTRNLTRALRIMKSLEAPVLGLSTSGFRISIITTAEKLDPALMKLHEEFIDKPLGQPCLP
jgi:aspartate kinase